MSEHSKKIRRSCSVPATPEKKDRNFKDVNLDLVSLSPIKLEKPMINPQLRQLERWRGDNIYPKFRVQNHRPEPTSRLPPDTLQRSNTMPPIIGASPNEMVLKKDPTCVMKSGKFWREGSKTPDPAIVRRQDTKSRRKKKIEFDALNRTCVPIPQLFDNLLTTRDYGKKNMQDWYTEVYKKPAERPPFAISLDWQAPVPERDTRQHYIYSNGSMFYKNQRHRQARNFTIDPEWESERTSVSIYSPAYRTWPIRYGWCC
ncbi:hypothetical protein ScPMuIL_018721 [Solemya velum]